MMTPSEFKTYAEIAEIGFKILAMIVIAVWAIYGLIVFRQRQAAITALRKSESEAASLELTAKRRAVLDISIGTDCRHDTAANSYVVSVQVLITNSGVAPAHMVFEQNAPAIQLRRVEFDSSGVMTMPHAAVPLPLMNVRDPTKTARARVVRAGGTSRLASVVRVRQPGVYAVFFRVPMDASNAQAMHEAGADVTRTQYWSATAFACVGLPPAVATERATTSAIA